MHNHAMHEHTGFFDSVVVHALEELVAILPFLFLTYLFMEFLEHRAGKRMENAVRRAGRVGPLWGSLLGIVPQCGFSAAAAGLYSGRVITLGTLLAVFLSTSDEMLPLMIGQENPLSIFKILGVKVVLAIIAGFSVDAVLRIRAKKQKEEHHEEHTHHEHHHDHNHHDHNHHEHEHHEHEHHEHEHRDAFAIAELCESEGCRCERGVWLSTLFHTLKTGGFLLALILLLNLLMFFIGEEALSHALTGVPFLSHTLSALVGLIPNCAASVVITELYLEGLISAGCMLSGLLVSAGLGLLLLFRLNRSTKECLLILTLLFGIGLLSGILIDVTGLGALL